MILILEPNIHPESVDYRMLTGQLERLSNVNFRVHREVGTEVTLTEIYLIGNTAALTVEQMQVLLDRTIGDLLAETTRPPNQNYTLAVLALVLLGIVVIIVRQRSTKPQFTHYP